MATDVTVRALWEAGDGESFDRAITSALQVFKDVEATCTRFDPESPLMKANARPTEAHSVPPYCFEALEEAYRAYRETGRQFDPRILRDLVALGYDRSLPFASGDVQMSAPLPPARSSLPRWRPRFNEENREVVLGSFPVDLGGIGKGLAVRWASLALGAVAPNHLVEAGGDCYCSGSAPGGEPWLIGVEDPFGTATPRAVVALRDLACASSSTRLRSWTCGGGPVHHLVDPGTGRPGGQGLKAVTVVMEDPADAEVWSKVLFLAGRSEVGAVAERRRLAALWVDDEGGVHTSSSMVPLMCWGPL